MTKESRSYDLLWLSLGLLFVIGLFFYMPVKANDYWWYMRLGRDVLQSGSVPGVETISYSQAGAPVINQQWLAGVIFYLLYQMGGLNLTYLIGALCLAFTYGMVWYMARRVSGPKLATLLLYLLVLCTSGNWVMRPQLLVYPLFMICVWALYHWHAGNNKYLFALPLSVLLWVNLHGSFILPFVLMGAAFIAGKGDRRSLVVAGVISLVAMMLSPYGYKALNVIFLQLNSKSNTFSVEWRPPNMSSWQDKIFFAWILLLAPLVSLFPKKLSLLEWVWLLGFCWLALSGVRYVIWFMLLLTIFTAVILGDWAKRTFDAPIGRTSYEMNILISILTLAFSFSYYPSVRAVWQASPLPAWDVETTPVQAVEWLSQHKELPGPIWNDYAFGSYLAFTMPERPVWIDARVHNYPYEQWEEYLQVAAGRNWETVFDREGINLLVLSSLRQDDLIQAVHSSFMWCEQYKDEYAVIFVRCEK